MTTASISSVSSVTVTNHEYFNPMSASFKTTTTISARISKLVETSSGISTKSILSGRIGKLNNFSPLVIKTTADFTGKLGLLKDIKSTLSSTSSLIGNSQQDIKSNISFSNKTNVIASVDKMSAIGEYLDGTTDLFKTGFLGHFDFVEPRFCNADLTNRPIKLLFKNLLNTRDMMKIWLNNPVFKEDVSSINDFRVKKDLTLNGLMKVSDRFNLSDNVVVKENSTNVNIEIPEGYEFTINGNKVVTYDYVPNSNADKLDGNEGDVFASSSDLDNHTSDTNNPHKVTLEQLNGVNKKGDIVKGNVSIKEKIKAPFISGGKVSSGKTYKIGTISGDGSNAMVIVSDTEGNGICFAKYQVGNSDNEFGGYWYQVGESADNGVTFRFSKSGIGTIDLYYTAGIDTKGTLVVLNGNGFTKDFKESEFVPTHKLNEERPMQSEVHSKGNLVYHEGNFFMNEFAVVSGTLEHNSLLPLPAGFTEDQCYWIVSTDKMNKDNKSWDIDENGRHLMYRGWCYVESDRVIKSYWYAHGHSSTPGYNLLLGSANYIVIGVK